MAPLAVVGRFPPPLDGQAVATARLADLLSSTRAVTRVDVGAPEGDHVVAPGGARIGRALHAVRLRARVRQALAETPGAPVLWPSVSPSPLGHLRDQAWVAPAFGDRAVVGVVHRGDFGRLFTSLWTRRTALHLVRRLAALVFLTDGLAEACAPWVPAAKRVVIPNTIDEDVIPPPSAVRDKRGRRASRAPAAPLRLLYLSAMIPSKGYESVLEATSVLRDRGVAVHTTFAGRWESEAAARHFGAEVERRRLGDSVVVKGGLGRSGVAALHLASDVLVLPTTYPAEAQPLVVIEALAAGTPVLVSRHAGLPEMVSDGVEGFFVRPSAPEEIADGAVQIAERWAEHSEAARDRFHSVYSPDAVRGQWEALLARISPTARPAAR